MTAIDPKTVEIRLKTPDPLFLKSIASVFIMDAGWAKEKGVEKAPDAKNPEKYYTDGNANGTGPFKPASRTPDAATKMVRHTGWWGNGKFPGNIDSVEARPMSNAATRVGALLSGDVNLVTEIPLPDIERVKADKRFTLSQKPHLRTMIFGFNWTTDKLESVNTDDNPFKKLAKIGIKVTLNALPRDQWGGLVTGKKADFYLLGFGTPTNDAAFIMANFLISGPFHMPRPSRFSPPQPKATHSIC